MIYLGGDHAGFELKEVIKQYLKEKGCEIKDFGAPSFNKDDDYPDFGYPVARAVADSDGKSKGILFCGSAEGICIVANKVKGVWAVAVWTPTNAKHSREHNDANVLCLSGGKTRSPIPGLSTDEAKKIVDVWLETPFSGEERHVRRLGKIKDLENG